MIIKMGTMEKIAGAPNLRASLRIHSNIEIATIAINVFPMRLISRTPFQERQRTI